MNKMRKFAFLTIVSVFIFLSTIPLGADDTALFTANVSPDVMIVLDMSGSMRWTPKGQQLYTSLAQCRQSITVVGKDPITGKDVSERVYYDVPYYPNPVGGNNQLCSVSDSAMNMPKWGDTTCSGPFYVSSRTGYTTDCSRLAMAKRVIFDILDEDDDNTVQKKDGDLLNIRMGYMRFYNCKRKEQATDYSTECNKEIFGIGTDYNVLWDSTNPKGIGREEISAPYECGGTVIVQALGEAKVYLDNHKNGVLPAASTADTAAECRKKFVILITDGQETYACQTDINEYGPNAKRRKATVKAAKELASAGYGVFVIGFGADMPQVDKNTLNWAAFYGGTNDPSEPDVPDLSGTSPEITPSADPCNEGDDNDPGAKSLSGYAFMAQDATTLSKSLKTVINYIKEKALSFTAPTVPSVRLADSNRVYISSFTPNATPFWRGDLKAYALRDDGTLPVDSVTKFPSEEPLWRASEVFKDMSPDSRTIYTDKSGSRVEFKYGNLTNADLGVSTDTDRENLVKHVRGYYDSWDIDEEPSTTIRTWKLGDIFHSAAVIVGAPSASFLDAGFSGADNFYNDKKNRTKVIIVGANDGMLHTFDATTGEEKWAFIPNSLLTSFKQLKADWTQYKATRVAQPHRYFVDGSPKVADVWFYSSSTDKTKEKGEWHTVLICGLRKGGKTYFALDITDTLNPVYLWQFPKPTDSATLALLGESWSDPAIGRIKIEVSGELVERWVAFIGGGYDKDPKDPTSGKGRGLFVVDIKTGDIIKDIFGDDGDAKTASPLVVDTNSDGYLDKIYIGDLGGKMYVADISNKNPNLWTGKVLFVAPAGESGKHPIYYQPSVALDRKGTPWVFFGTGDREKPTENTTERFYAIKDNDLGPYPRQANGNDLVDVSTNPTNFTPVPDNKYGWTIKLTAANKEKVLAKAVVFNGLVYFTTFSPLESDTDSCTTGGTARLYVAEYLSGGGALEVDDLADLAGSTTGFTRSKVIGSGDPSAPVISLDEHGQATIIIGTTETQIHSFLGFSPVTNKEVLYWREVIP
jgi:hypothetical protein